MTETDTAEISVVRCWLANGHAFDGWGYYFDEYPDEGVCGPFDSRAAAMEAGRAASVG